MKKTKITLKELNLLLNEPTDDKVFIDTITGLETISKTYTKQSEGTHIRYSDDTETIGSINHLVWHEGDWKRLCQLEVGDIIESKTVISKEQYPVTDWIDFTVEAEHQSYIQNGIIHHNSGKSLIQYLIAREYLNLVENKILIVVPTISLVTQLYNDFIEYSKNDDFDVEAHCHLIFEGNVKNSDKQIVISTYQSIYNEPCTRDDEKKTTKRGNLYFEDFDAVMVDECHTVKGASLQSIMAKCINARYRIGVTGTLDGSLTNEMVLKGQFGPIHRVANTTDLMDRNILSNLRINFINIKYDEQTCINMKHADYHMEMDWLCTNPIRNNKICQMANKLKGNTLILVQYIEKHGKVLEIMLKDMCIDKQVFFVYGNTESEDREKIRKIAEEHSNVIILASYQVFSTGVNIKNLPNIIFGSPTKSKIRLLQSIGRGVRLHDDKEFLRVIDLCDDLRYAKRKSFNYILAHAMERLRIYQVEGFDVIESEITLKCS